MYSLLQSFLGIVISRTSERMVSPSRLKEGTKWRNAKLEIQITAQEETQHELNECFGQNIPHYPSTDDKNRPSSALYGNC